MYSNTISLTSYPTVYYFCFYFFFFGCFSFPFAAFYFLSPLTAFTFFPFEGSTSLFLTAFDDLFYDFDLFYDLEGFSGVNKDSGSD